MAGRRDGVTIPRIWLAIAFSIAVHVALLLGWRYDVRFPSEGAEIKRGPLVVQIVPRASPPPVPRRAPAPEARPRLPRAKSAPPKAPPKPAKPAPPVLARREPAPNVPVPPPEPAVPATPPARAPEGDLAAFVEARRRARGEPSAPAAPVAAPSTGPAEDANARASRLAAANLGTDKRPSFGSDPRKGGGVFSVERLSYDSAELTFFGWNKDIQRNTLQLIEVRKGSEPDIRIAVVRRMIAIIREQEKEDFMWESKRLGRNLLLSARLRDNAGLEEFLMREFFGDPRRP
ncbi:MAG: hypothetical protein ACXWUH_12215 [Burkholderiales bacterium]